MDSPSPRDGAKPTAQSVLVVEDDAVFRRLVVRLLEAEGWTVTATASVQEGLSTLRALEAPPDVVLTDLHLPDGSGLEVLDVARTELPDAVAVVMTGEATFDSAVDAMRRGAYDYLVKPFPHPSDLITKLSRAVEHKALRARNRMLEQKLELRERFGAMIGASSGMRALFATIDAVAPTSATVLVIGETGTGKELVARAIHERSPRHTKPFIAVDCGALTETVLESELFGHGRGAFTGATTARRGIFEEANGGTVFLDEIGELPLAMQPRLLRVLQEREVRPVGTNVARPVDVRVVAATHRDLAAEVEKGRFRQDLFYRLNVITVRTPPLRDRPDDIPLLAQRFVAKHAARHGLAVDGIEPEALQALSAHRWPGNVRELENAIERGVVLARNGTVVLAGLPAELGAPVRRPVATSRAPELPFREAVAAFERAYLERALGVAGGKVAETARNIGMDRSNLSRVLRRHGLLSPGDDATSEGALEHADGADGPGAADDLARR